MAPNDTHTFIDYYAILDLKRDEEINQDVLKRKFQARARMWHPDMAKDQKDQKEKDELTEKFKILNEANMVLGREQTRVAYNKIYDGRQSRIKAEQAREQEVSRSLWTIDQTSGEYRDSQSEEEFTDFFRDFDIERETTELMNRLFQESEGTIRRVFGETSPVQVGGYTVDQLVQNQQESRQKNEHGRQEFLARQEAKKQQKELEIARVREEILGSTVRLSENDQYIVAAAARLLSGKAQKEITVFDTMKNVLAEISIDHGIHLKRALNDYPLCRGDIITDKSGGFDHDVEISQAQLFDSHTIEMNSRNHEHMPQNYAKHEGCLKAIAAAVADPEGIKSAGFFKDVPARLQQFYELNNLGTSPIHDLVVKDVGTDLDETRFEVNQERVREGIPFNP